MANSTIALNKYEELFYEGYFSHLFVNRGMETTPSEVKNEDV